MRFGGSCFYFSILFVMSGVILGIGSSTYAQRASRLTDVTEVRISDITHLYPENVALLAPKDLLPTKKPPTKPMPGRGASTGDNKPGQKPEQKPGAKPPGKPPSKPDRDSTDLPDPYPSDDPPSSTGIQNLDTLILLGERIGKFFLSLRPQVEIKPLKAAIVPEGLSWTQMKGWKRPEAKVYRVQMLNRIGQNAASFDYRITTIAGGSYQGRGKFIGQVSFIPFNLKSNMDASLTVEAKLLDPINFGTETDPLAGVQLQITWSISGITRYQMNSAEYFIYGDGTFEKI